MASPIDDSVLLLLVSPMVSTPAYFATATAHFRLEQSILRLGRIRFSPRHLQCWQSAGGPNYEQNTFGAASKSNGRDACTHRRHNVGAVFDNAFGMHTVRCISWHLIQCAQDFPIQYAQRLMWIFADSQPGETCRLQSMFLD